MQSITFGCLIVLVIVIALYSVYRIYQKGADPLSADSVKELNSILESSKIASSSSANSRTVKVSYLSPSNVILSSIQRYNAAAERDGDDAAAAGTASHAWL